MKVSKKTSKGDRRIMVAAFADWLASCTELKVAGAKKGAVVTYQEVDIPKEKILLTPEGAIGFQTNSIATSLRFNSVRCMLN
jgi:hypothetical protein